MHDRIEDNTGPLVVLLTVAFIAAGSLMALGAAMRLLQSAPLN